MTPFASAHVAALVSFVLVAACGSEVRFPGEDPDADDPCASRDDDACNDEICQALWEGDTCDGPADYVGCVSRTRVGCHDDGCDRGATCETLSLGVCAGPPGAITCLACGATDTGVCSR